MVRLVADSPVPERCDVVWISLDPQVGHEQAGRRPALILSPSAYNRKVGLALICPITNQVKGYPFEVMIPGGLAVTGVVLADHVKNIDWRFRRAEIIGRVPGETLDKVLAKLKKLLSGTPY